MNKAVFAGALFAAVAGVSTVAYCGTSDTGISPRSVAFVGQGDDLLSAERPEAAILQYETALAIDPRNVTAYIGLARAHEDLGLPGRAVKFYREGLTIDPNNLTALEEQGEALVARGATARAEKNLDRIRKLCASECAYAARLKDVIDAGPPPVESAKSVAASETMPDIN
ncbi:MAG: tetratricopeptide repeat protein [Pseudomonadota bacterium]